MSGAAPWSVKGIEPRTREVAKDLARRSGMTLGEWLSEMIADNGEDDYVPLSRRARARRADDDYGLEAAQGASTMGAIEALSARIEAAERRSTLAIDGVDKAVGGLVRRMEAIADDAGSRDRRIDNIGEELREGRGRLRQMETDLGPRNTEAFGKIDAAIGKLSGQFYEAEQRGRDASVILRERMDKFEREHSPERLIDGAAARVAARLEEAQARTAQSLAKLELSFADLDRRMSMTERNGANAGAGGMAFERLAESLSRKVEDSRAELLRRMETTVADSRLDKFERAMADLAAHVQASEKRSVEALETMGREVLRIAENLNHRVSETEAAQAESQERAVRAVEAMGQDLSRSLSGEVAKVADAVDQRMRRADDQHAVALERLGGEISRISERLAERIALGERRAAQGVDELAERVTRASEKLESRYERASGELGERMRQSEERTAALLAEARDSIDRQLRKRAEPDIAADWRDPAFPSQDFSTDWPGSPTAALDPAFPSDPVFVDEPALTPASMAVETPAAAPAAAIEDDVFAPDPAFEPPVYAEATAIEAAPESAAFAEPAAAEPVFAERAYAEQIHADDDVIDDEVLIETMPAFEPARDMTAPAEPIAAFGEEVEPFEAEPAFAAQAPARPMSTREALAAARATVTEDHGTDLEDEKPRGLRLGFGGKSRLQKRMEKQAKGGSTMRTAMVATVIAVVAVGAGTAGVLAYRDVVAQGTAIPTLPGGEDGLLAASATSPTAPEIAPPAPEAEARGAALFAQATPLIESGDAEGVRLMSQAANLGYPQAQFAMARLYETGEAGVTADPVEARRWTERAARGGEARAMHNLALYLFEGTGGDQDPAGALQWFQAAAERGLVDSQYNLGRLYERGGEGLSPDPAKAYEWYIVAARAGDTEAQAGVERLRNTLSTTDRLQAEAQAGRFEAQATTQG